MRNPKIIILAFLLVIGAIYYAVYNKSVIVYIDGNTSPEIQKILLDELDGNWVTTTNYSPNYSLKIVKKSSDKYRYSNVIHFIQIGSVEVAVIENGIYTTGYKLKNGQWAELDSPNIKVKVTRQY